MKVLRVNKDTHKRVRLAAIQSGMDMPETTARLLDYALEAADTGKIRLAKPDAKGGKR